MYSYKNARFHDEIRKWNTKQLLEALESNGLGECCAAVETRQIDGDTFLNLTEGQLAFWRLSNVQTKRLWSHIQLARDKPQDFITNIPESNPTPTGTLNNRKIKSPIADSLNNLFGQQNNPAPVLPPQQLEVPESNYPKVMPPLNPNNDFQQRTPPRPDAFPPKPPNFQNKRIPVPPTSSVNTPQDFSSRPPVSFYPKPHGLPSNFPPHPQPEEEDFYEEEPMAQPQSDFQPSVNPMRPTNFQNKRIPVPPMPVVNSPQDSPRPIVGVPQPAPPSFNPYPKPPGPPPIIPQLPLHEEEVYEEEPMAQHQNNFQSPLSSINQSSLYNIPPPNPIPVRRVAPVPTNIGRPLPTPPKDETPYRLPPNVVPITRNARSPQPPDVPDLPRPTFRPPTSIPNFHDHDDDNDDEQPEYDFVDEAHLPEYRRQSWFKDVERKEAGKLLRGRPNGTFIARPSKQPDYECTFSVIYDRKIYNLPVMKESGKVVLGKNSFNSVTDIVEKFFENPLVLNGPNNEDLYVTLKKF